VHDKNTYHTTGAKFLSAASTASPAPRALGEKLKAFVHFTVGSWAG